MDIKETLKTWQDKGVPVYLFRDKGGPSITFTLFILSSCFVMFGLINGAAKIVGGVDMESCLYWNGICAASYLQRKYSKKEGLSGPTEEKNTKE